MSLSPSFQRCTHVFSFRMLLLSIFVSYSSAFGLKQGLFPQLTSQRNRIAQPSPRTLLFNKSEKDSSAQDALERTAAHLEKLNKGTRSSSSAGTVVLDPELEQLKQEYLQKPANALKEELKARKLPRNGRKPDLALRLAEYDLQIQSNAKSPVAVEPDDSWLQKNLDQDYDLKEFDPSVDFLSSFAGLRLSQAAGTALGKAGFTEPTPIQQAALPRLQSRESLVLHAETGSGKSLCYLLPLTETLWKSSEKSKKYVILTPTRELAAQVAGVATVLAPPGTVRLIPYATNLATDGSKDTSQSGGRQQVEGTPQIFIGSAKAVLHSLYGDGNKMPASPTPKPLAMEFLRSVDCLVLDEVDRLLNVKKARSDKVHKKMHEKPAAILTAAVQRSTLGRAQVVAASATVGRPLKRELARVLGLLPHECPPVVRGGSVANDDEIEDHIGQNSDSEGVPSPSLDSQHIRAVTIPETVDHYIYTSNGSSEGKLLTAAYQVIQQLQKTGRSNRKILMVLSKSFGMNTGNVLGALKHFNCEPQPKSLLDVLEADGTDQMIQTHRQVSGAGGVGESYTTAYFDPKSDEQASPGYLLVTGEDTVRGLHLDGLELVLVVGRPNGPDEYTHIAGRTGRAGKYGQVINVVSTENAASLKSWERMLHTDFTHVENLEELQKHLQS